MGTVCDQCDGIMLILCDVIGTHPLTSGGRLSLCLPFSILVPVTSSTRL